MPAAFAFFDMRHASNHNPSLTRTIRGLDPFAANDDSAGREIRSMNELHQIFNRDIIHPVIVIDQEDDGVCQFPQVVRGNIGCHTHCNT